VFLNTSTLADYYKNTYFGVSGSWNSWWITDQTSENQTENTYSHGKGATNMTRTLLSVGYVYYDWFPVFESAPDTYERYTTNREVFAWGTNGLLTGIGTNSDHTIDYYWFPPISVLGADTNAVVVSTNVAPPTVPYAPWTLTKSGTMTTNYDNSTNITGITTNFWSEKSTLSLATSGTDTNLSALFCLTGSVTDPYTYWPISNFPILSGWKLAGEVPDGAGRVFKIFNDGSTNDASVELESSLTGTNYYYTYDVGVQRVGLTLEWKSSNTNDTNWQSGKVFVLKGDTVAFRVTTGSITNVAWPTGKPAWSGGGSSGTGADFSITFNTVSADTNGINVVVEAGSKVTNQVVVFDYTVRFKPDAQGAFTGRAEYPTNFGVGEEVNFSVKSDPEGLSPNVAWNATGMSATGDFDDRSVYLPSASSFKAGAFAETISVTATLTDVPSAGGARTNTFSVIRPTNAILKDYRITTVPLLTISLPYLVLNPNVGHLTNSETCWKVSSYFILPQSVSFHGISVREGAGPYAFSGGYFAGISAELATNGFNAPWHPPTMTGGPLVTNIYATFSQHTPGTPRPCTHHQVFGTGAIEPNYLNLDWFGVGPPGSGNQPYPLAHQSFLLTSLSGTIAVEFQLASAIFYNITNVISKRDYFSDASVTVEKAGSGPHTKAYASPTTPE
jgi:hypothetical protein